MSQTPEEDEDGTRDDVVELPKDVVAVEDDSEDVKQDGKAPTPEPDDDEEVDILPGSNARDISDAIKSKGTTLPADRDLTKPESSLKLEAFPASGDDLLSNPDDTPSIQVCFSKP